MTREEAIKRLEIIATNICGQAAQNPNLWPDYKAFDMAISALSAQQEQERNDPLALDELRQMDGEPVWIAGGGFWALVNTHSFGFVALIENSGGIVKAEGWMKHMGAIYRRKPEEGTV